MAFVVLLLSAEDDSLLLVNFRLDFREFLAEFANLPLLSLLIPFDPF